MTIDENVPLAPLTTFRLGGPAGHFVRVRTVEELQESLDYARDQNLATLILGGGSNILLHDAGFDGLVIKIELMGVAREADTLVAGAGESWDTLVECAVQEGLWGLENLSGIPGTVGGAVVQGIGAYGAAVGETLVWVEVLDTETGESKKMRKEECRFDYRDSFFKHDAGRHVIVGAAFVLSAEPKPELSYRDLSKRFSDTTPGLAAIREAVLDIRKGKFPDLSVEGTAGSFFKNPILPPAEAQKLQEAYPEMPLFAMPETAGIKIPLAWLLDHVLQVTGMQEGGARLYERQPLVIVAARNARAEDVVALAQKIKKLAKEKLQLDIEEEVRIIS